MRHAGVKRRSTYMPPLIEFLEGRITQEEYEEGEHPGAPGDESEPDEEDFNEYGARITYINIPPTTWTIPPGSPFLNLTEQAPIIPKTN